MNVPPAACLPLTRLLSLSALVLATAVPAAARPGSAVCDKGAVELGDGDLIFRDGFDS